MTALGGQYHRESRRWALSTIEQVQDLFLSLADHEILNILFNFSKPQFPTL